MAEDDPRGRIATGAAGEAQLSPVYEQRLAKLHELMGLAGADAMVLTDPSNIYYYTGFHGVEPIEREAIAVVTPNTRYLVTRQLYFGQTPPTFQPKDLLYADKAMAEVISETGAKTLGIEEENMVVKEYKDLLALGIKTTPVEAAKPREIKDEAEIDEIRRACQAGDTTFTHMVEFMRANLHPGITEKQLRDELEVDMKRQGYDKTAFPTIVAFGVNSADPHHMADDSQLKANSFITFDFGFTGETGYRSDMTRTVFFGNPSDEQRRLYQTTLEAQQKVIDHLNETFAAGPTTTIVARDLDAVARNHILAAGYAADHFPHGLGHGIGLETHEKPYVNKKSTQELRAGMVFSDEPGIYIPGQEGVRIEDLIAIHQNGQVEVLTQSPKELITISESQGDGSFGPGSHTRAIAD